MSDVLERALCELETLPADEQQRIVRLLQDEIHRAKVEPTTPAGRWARLAARLTEESPFAGRSAELRRVARAFRDGFGIA